MARSVHTTTESVRAHEELTGTVQSKEECADRDKPMEGQQL
jgi:hypothetical protein